MKRYGQDKDGNEITFLDVVESEEKSVEDEIDLKMKIRKLYKKIGEVLQDRERMIIELRFGLNGRECKTQNQIAKELGISRSYVSRIETKAINKLSREFLPYRRYSLNVKKFYLYFARIIAIIFVEGDEKNENSYCCRYAK